MPAVFEVVFVVAFAIAVPVIVFYLIGEAGWRALAKRYRASVRVQRGRGSRCAHRADGPESAWTTRSFTR